MEYLIIFAAGWYCGFFFLHYVLQKKPKWAVSDVQKLKKFYGFN